MLWRRSFALWIDGLFPAWRRSGGFGSCCFSSRGATSRSATSRRCLACSGRSSSRSRRCLVFGRVARIDSGNIPYPVFLYAGLLPWEFFSEAVNRSGHSLVSAADLMKEVPFPRAVLPLASVGGVLVDFVISFAILIGLMLYWGVTPQPALLIVIPLTAGLILTAVGVGMAVSALNAVYRDLKYALPFVVQVWMFVTPVVYPSSAIPGRFRWLLQVNPMSGIIDGFRSVILGVPLDWVGLLVSLGVGLAILALAWVFFSRIELYLTDVV
jgi:lipopolysaccharide transport system permease protein